MVSTDEGTHTDSGTLFSGNSLFIDWAVLNDGSEPTNTTYRVTLSVDGQDVQTWKKDPSHQPGFFIFVEDFELDALSPGTHTLTLLADSTSQIAESNESDNEYIKTITVTEGIPNLTPFRPSGWSDRIVVSTDTGGHTDSGTLFSGIRHFVDWAVLNDGTRPTDPTYRVTLSVDGQDVQTWKKDPSHQPGFFIFVEDFELDAFSPGTHTLTLLADSTSQIAESNESDNEYTKTITVIEGDSQPDTVPAFRMVRSDCGLDQHREPHGW